VALEGRRRLRGHARARPRRDPVLRSALSVEVGVLCGTAGVGKTATAHELALQLGEADVAHVVLDTDELDRVHPWPPPGFSTSELSRRALAALWAEYGALGHTRLILCAVMVDVPRELAWIANAVPGAAFTVFRLGASRPVLEERVRRREVGSGAEAQLERTLRYLDEIDDPPDVVQLDTSAADVAAVARTVGERLGWLL
jgi:predicted kinase